MSIFRSRGLFVAGAGFVSAHLLSLPHSRTMQAQQNQETSGFFTEPATNIAYPTFLQVPASLDRFKFYGAGVRKVTFLQFHTYALGFYASEQDVAKHQVQDTKSLVTKCRTLLRLVPVRNTNGTHLRNAFGKMLTEMVFGMPEAESAKIKAEIDEFVTAFPQTLPVGSELLVVIQPQKDVSLYFNGVFLKKVESKWLPENLAGQYVASEKPLIAELYEQVKKSFPA